MVWRLLLWLGTCCWKSVGWNFGLLWIAFGFAFVCLFVYDGFWFLWFLVLGWFGLVGFEITGLDFDVLVVICELLVSWCYLGCCGVGFCNFVFELIFRFRTCWLLSVWLDCFVGVTLYVSLYLIVAVILISGLGYIVCLVFGFWTLEFGLLLFLGLCWFGCFVGFLFV